MPHVPIIKSALKRERIIAKRTARNAAIRSSMRTAIKKFLAGVAAGDKAKAQELYDNAASVVDKAQKRGVVHRNMAARKKSQMAKALNKMA